MEDRSVRIDQILHAEAQEPFRLWNEKEDRTDYGRYSSQERYFIRRYS